METLRKLRPHLKRAVTISLVVAVLLISLIVFIKSPSFINFLESIISSRIDRPVEIGGLSLKDGHRLVINNLIIKEGKQGGPHIIVPQAEIRFSLRGLLKKNIERISIERPRLSIVVKKREGKEEKRKTKLPFTVNNIFINDAAISLQLEKGKSYNISAINVSLAETPQKGKSEFRGEAFISEINSKIHIDAIADVEEFNIEKAHAEVPAVDLEILSAIAPCLFLKALRSKEWPSLSLIYSLEMKACRITSCGGMRCC